jgi:hypothetical protein
VIIKGSEFVPAPEGMHNAVCVDVADLGIVDGTFGPKHQCKIVWEIEAKMDDGRPFTVSRRYTVSLNEKSNLSKDLRSWRGKAFTPEELKGFDTERLIGVPCQVLIQHAEREGQVYGNVTTVIKAGPTKLQPTGKYVRHKDREGYKAPAAAASQPAEEFEEVIPF